MSEVRYLFPVGDTKRVIPHCVEAEQAVLGILLLTPEGIDELGQGITSELFFDTAHARLFDVMLTRHRRGQLISPVTLKLWAEGEETFKDLGGPAYLVRLAGAAPGRSSLKHYSDYLAQLLAKRKIAEALWLAEKDLEDDEIDAQTIAGRLEAALMTIEGASPSARRPVSIMRAVTEATEDALAAYNGEAEPLVSTGIPSLDRILGGFAPAELIVLGGRPSMGKTATALEIALNAARAGHKVGIASLEMTPKALAVRALSEATAQQSDAIAYSRIRRGDMDERQLPSLKAALHSVSDLPIQILPASYRDVGSLYGGFRQVEAILGGLDMILIDYLQLLDVPGANRYEKITAATMALKGLGALLDVPVIALSQLSRQVEARDEKRPMLSDLRESGQIEQDADTIIFAYRDEYYLERQEPEVSKVERHEAWLAKMEGARNRLELIVAKQRQGEIGTARVRFNPALNLIWEDRLHG